MDRLAKIRSSARHRAHRVRTVVKGTEQRPRLSVNISNYHVTAQLIDDSRGVTLAYATTTGKKATGNLTDKAAAIGKDIAAKAKKAGVKRVVLDRGAKQYHGRIKALAEAARNEGLEF